MWLIEEEAGGVQRGRREGVEEMGRGQGRKEKEEVGERDETAIFTPGSTLNCVSKINPTPRFPC